MKTFVLITLLLPASALLLFSKGLKIADSIIFDVPDGWTYLDSHKKQIPERGTLISATLENPGSQQKLTVSVLKVDTAIAGVSHADELIAATLSPWIKAAREQGLHPNPGHNLARGQFIFYSQELGYPNAKQVELRGVLMQLGSDWVNFFCTGPDEISWQHYQDLITGTQLLSQ